MPRSRRGGEAPLGWLALIAGAVVGCGSSSPAASDAGANPGATVWSSDATKAIIENRGGGLTVDAGPSDCQASSRYTVTVADRMLVWSLCTGSATDPALHQVNGQRSLTSAEMKSVSDALGKVTLSPADMCGADKEILVLTVVTPGGSSEYLDNFYACQKKGTYVANIDGVFQSVAPLATK